MNTADFYQILKLIAALVFVLSLMGGLAFLLKKSGITGAMASSSGPRRLKVLETLPLDGRRKLVLLQRDNKQHLVILGVNGETVVETNITIPKNDGKKSA